MTGVEKRACEYADCLAELEHLRRQIDLLNLRVREQLAKAKDAQTALLAAIHNEEYGDRT